MPSFNLVIHSVNFVMGSSIMWSLYALFLWAIFIRSFYVLCLCALLLCSLYSLFICALFMCSLYSLILCALFMCFFYALFLCALFMHSFYALFVFTLFMCSFYVLFSCTILMCSFHKRLAILRMHKKYHCTKTNMADNKMNDVLKKLGLSHHRARLVEEKISTNIVCYLSIEGFLKLGLTDLNAIMSLRIDCSTFSLCTPQKAVGTKKFVIPKILIENLI